MMTDAFMDNSLAAPSHSKAASENVTSAARQGDFETDSGADHAVSLRSSAGFAEAAPQHHVEPPIGDMYQADIASALGTVETLDELAKGGTLVWDPTRLSESAVDAFVADTRLSGVYTFYNFASLDVTWDRDDEYVCPMERVLQELHGCNYDVDAAMRSLQSKGLKWHPQRPSHKRWTRNDIEQLERGLAYCPLSSPNKFTACRDMGLSHKSLEEIIEFYYYWKLAGQDFDLLQPDGIPRICDLGTPEPEPLFPLHQSLQDRSYGAVTAISDDLAPTQHKKRKYSAMEQFTTLMLREPPLPSFPLPNAEDLAILFDEALPESFSPPEAKRAKLDLAPEHDSPVMSPRSDIATAIPSSPDDELSVDSFVAFPIAPDTAVVSSKPVDISGAAKYSQATTSRCSTPDSECEHLCHLVDGHQSYGP